MTDEADSHTADTSDSTAQKPDSLTRSQRTRALYHFLSKVDTIIKKRCALLLERQTRDKAVSGAPQRQETQEPPSFDHSVTPRCDDELTGRDPAETPKR
ncbi:hypothetical protein FXN65_11115 [Metapseudomonas lalkuanensis]|uniref:Uncharacterized protein n=1 Tax=Metapseudomonas lalkuanensis TaxID=2604832 RepID=A0A5J6QPR2_9GAMM|nr:hypothetical protein [Pseudomonas lalkuanensis]QEY62599.1 hypothetical protein FXN65_11115 [Pseudomonas lalkuanensis]UCO96176.1 hypothetical protein LF844_15940 [Pseudomonas lalkuanensis]